MLNIPCFHRFLLKCFFTPSTKQSIVYTPYCTDKAQKDCAEIGPFPV